MKIRILPLVLLVMLLLSACGGELSISYDVTETPDPAFAATMQVLETRIATLQANSPASLTQPTLDMSTDSDTIEQALLNSHNNWQTLWIDGVITDQTPEGEQAERVQMWVDRANARFRVLSGPAGDAPQTMQVSDGMTQERINLLDVTRQMQPVSAEARGGEWQTPPEPDAVYPHPLDLEIDARLSQAIFPAGLAQRGGTYSPTGLESIAGRDALMVEWWSEGDLMDRFWLDTQTGLVLRWENYGKPNAGDGPTATILVNALAYDIPVPEDFFSLRLSERPRFALDPSGNAGPTPEPPAAVFEPGAGELYFVINSDPEPLQLVRLPESCVTGSEACPVPVLVENFPNTNSMIQPMIWSPDGAQAALVNNGVLYVYTPADLNWKAVAQFPILPQDAVWSPDGEWLAFVSQDAEDRQDLYAVHSDGSSLQNLTNGQFHGPETWLHVDGWTSNQQLLFSVFNREVGQLNTLTLGEAQARPMPHNSFRHGVIALSPDRAQIAYSTSQENAAEIYITGLDGAAPMRAASFQRASIQQVLWSPDGERLIFLVISGSGPEDIVNTVYSIRADGSDLRQLFQQQNIQRLIFTGDGQNLISEGTNNGRLYVIPVEDGEPRLLDAPSLRLDQPLQGISWR